MKVFICYGSNVLTFFPAQGLRRLRSEVLRIVQSNHRAQV